MPLHLLVKWEVVYPNSRWGKLESISIISFYSLVLIFLEKQFFLISRFMLFSTLKKNNIDKCPFTYWLNGRWFLQIVDGESWNLYPLYPLFSCSDFVSQMWGGLGGGGGVMFFSHFYAISKISRNKIWEYKTNYFSFNVFFVFFFVCCKY